MNLPAVQEGDLAVIREDAEMPYVGRAAICFMPVEAAGDDAALYAELTQALKDDPRVETVVAPPSDEQEFMRPILSSFGSFEDDESVDDNAAPDPFSHLHPFTFRFPILLQVRSPRRLQRKYDSFTHIPADLYWAAWDGLTLVALWEPEVAKDGDAGTLEISDLHKSLSPSGGLLIQDILEDVSKKCEADFRTVPCSPNCGYTFAHSNLVIRTIGKDNETVFHDRDDDGLIHVALATKHTPRAAVLELLFALQFTGRVFARLRSDGRTMDSAARLAHRDVSDLLQLNYERAVLSTKPILRSLVERFRARHWRRQARMLVARISLDLVTLERARSDWARTRALYDDSAQSRNSGVVFKREYELGVSAVSTIEVREPQSAIERVTGSLDTRALVLATALGAIVGALIGAIVGSLL